MPPFTSPTAPRPDLGSYGGPGWGTLRTPFVTLRFGGFEIPLLDAASYAADDPTRPIVPSALLLVDFVYSLSTRIGVGNNVMITMLDPQWDYLERLVSEAGGEGNRKLFSFSFGWRGMDDDKLGQQGVTFFLNGIDITTQPFQGARITLRGTDQGIKLCTRAESRSFAPTTPISQVIKQVIESDPSLEGEIDEIPTPVGPDLNRMENRTPMEYIRTLLSVSKSSLGSNTFAWVIRPSAITGKTKIIITEANSSVIKQATHSYIYGRDRDGEMFSYTPHMDGALILALGGGRSSGIGIDPRTKTITKVQSTQNEDPKSEAKRVHQTPEVDTKIHEIPFRSLDQIEGFVRGQRSRIDLHAYSASATVLGNIGLQPLDFINILMMKNDPIGNVTGLDSNSLYQFGSGTYRIDQVEHLISGGTFRTNLTLFKNSGFVGEGEEGQPIPITFSTPRRDDFGNVVAEVRPLRTLDSPE